MTGTGGESTSVVGRVMAARTAALAVAGSTTTVTLLERGLRRAMSFTFDDFHLMSMIESNDTPAPLRQMSVSGDALTTA
jgi:hypothetical protein